MDLVEVYQNYASIMPKPLESSHKSVALQTASTPDVVVINFIVNNSRIALITEYMTA